MESGLECPCMNNEDFTVLVSGDGRCCWVSMWTVWLSHSKWLSKQSIKFCVKLEHSSAKLFRWFRSPQLWATGDWQLHHDNVSTHASHLAQRFLVKHQITQVTQSPYSPDLAPWDFLLFPKLMSLLEGRDIRPSMRFRKIWQSSWWWLGERHEVARCLLWRGQKLHCPMYNVSCILYLLQ